MPAGVKLSGLYITGRLGGLALERGSQVFPEFLDLVGTCDKQVIDKYSNHDPLASGDVPVHIQAGV